MKDHIITLQFKDTNLNTKVITIIQLKLHNINNLSWTWVKFNHMDFKTNRYNKSILTQICNSKLKIGTLLIKIILKMLWRDFLTFLIWNSLLRYKTIKIRIKMKMKKGLILWWLYFKNTLQNLICKQISKYSKKLNKSWVYKITTTYHLSLTS